jgi:hypothetical protein
MESLEERVRLRKECISNLTWYEAFRGGINPICAEMPFVERHEQRAMVGD